MRSHFCSVVIGILFCAIEVCVAQQRSNYPAPQLASLVNSTNGAVRFNVAEKLSADHSEESFKALLKLLADKNEDISYAAAESIEARKDRQFDGFLIETIKTLPRNNRWPSYRAAKYYGTERMLTFLEGSLTDELKLYRGKKNFDSENCFYLAQSIEQIVRSSNKSAQVVAPTGTSFANYEAFLKEIKNEKTRNRTSGAVHKTVPTNSPSHHN